MANHILTKVKEHPQSWTRVDTILEHSSSDASKYIALTILDDLIKFRWKILPAEQRTGIKNYVVNLLIKLTTNEELSHRHRLVVKRLNAILVQILKQDWPHHWTTFIEEIVTASRNNECICENNMAILGLLSEEVFDFSRGEMTQAKIVELKSSLNKEFNIIYQLCEFVLTNSSKPSLIYITLDTLLRYLSWIPVGYIFETNLIPILSQKFLSVPTFRNVVIKCFTEISSLQLEGSYTEQFENLFVSSLNQLQLMLPLDTDFRTIHSKGKEDDQNFIVNLAQYLSTFFDNHRNLVEKEAHFKNVFAAHQYLVQISQVEEPEVFKICLDYWNHMTKALYNEVPIQGSIRLDRAVPTPRRMFYAPILSRVRSILISRMAKPEEMIIVEDENGQLIRERVPDGAATALYKEMRQTLILLTHLDYDDTQNIMTEKLQAQIDGYEWSWNKLNTLCWAIGSISGVFAEDREKRFIVHVIKELLGMCENKKGKDNKAVIAGNIMYIVGQYPRFLKAHYKFLTTVVHKLFEFMHEIHPGVQDMSCDTFLKIAKTCKNDLSSIHPQETTTFTYYVLMNLASITSDLSDQQVYTFFEAVGHMIGAHDAHEIDGLVSKLLESRILQWQDIMNSAKQNAMILKNVDVMRKLASILRAHTHACSTVGPGFLNQLGRIYLDVLNVCKYYSEEISKAVASEGVNVTKTHVVKEMRAVKRETLNLITTYIGVAIDVVPIVQNFLPPLLPAVLDDYRASVPDARDHEVLTLIEKIVSKCKGLVTGEIPRMFNSVFECTLGMITKNFEDYPEIRLEFFKFLRSVNKYCFEAFKFMPPEQFKLVIHSIVWAMKHTVRNVAETGLETLDEMIGQVNTDLNVANAFYQSYYLSLVQDIFYVLTDTFHKSGFKLHTKVLQQMIFSIESGSVVAPLDAAQVTDPKLNNRVFLREYMMKLLASAFQNLSEKEIRDFVVGLFDLSKDQESFKNLLRDFLVKMKEFSGGDDNALLYKEDQEKAQVKQDMAVPGLIRRDEDSMNT
eukprot:TRINITY_DN4063_c0_g1_i2.p1 TRINITY_DN4063_c0_g1~~TRINITY_DN4063_c0_g1_i2.p1  ORF type:complete len:1062 (-),score=182.79 TRINITY_DN4063_c0_g1_i2:21-3074(-)